ncbi:hypothetical protein D3D03_09210 [Exiguobacterium sp. RIT452]|uniref:Uncharacterized protein n=1 Tax=Exiguobacterium undae TaxID=169177 RepID=A0ABX2V849_9BACL|nr:MULTISPECIES: hypothetical protein [Exiguobacterium]OAN12724.1 hypothetical protein A3783_10405 [Exiguobacterium undae]RJO98914.1 hypothetical protein D3D03_09210 [Exiguobacterium sp. RIT452]
MNWNELKEESEIRELLEDFGYFHDGCLKEMHMWTETYIDENLTMAAPSGLDTNVKLLFQRQFKNPSAIELWFEGVTGIHILPTPENFPSILFEAVILKQHDTYYWSDDVDFDPSTIEQNVSWISAKKLRWRERNDWMGKQHRYGSKG